MPDKYQWDDASVAEMWDANAPVWAELSRQGYDQYRDMINTPAFMAILPDVRGLQGLDVGCGEGYNTRLAAGRGARMTALDVSPQFIARAIDAERQQPLGTRYLLASGSHLPFADASFDFVMSTMCLMDMPDYQGAVNEVARVLRSGGFFQYSISHPCMTPEGEWVIDAQGKRIGRVVRGYFDQPSGDVEEWIFGSAPKELTNGMRRFRIPRFPRTLSGWLNPLFQQGLVLECVEEPHPSKRQVHKYPRLADARIAAYFLLLRCRKP
ncbi:MAG: class I SAM-dependent methyltransferase [Chloroflexi bacterium]|nr:class I SAM-dependent methyltransferase [Chloroflexota bacterium]